MQDIGGNMNILKLGDPYVITLTFQQILFRSCEEFRISLQADLGDSTTNEYVVVLKNQLIQHYYFSHKF